MPPVTRAASFKRSRLGDISNRLRGGKRQTPKGLPKAVEKPAERRSARTSRRASGNGRLSTPIRPGGGFALLSSDLLELIFQHCLWSVSQLTNVAVVCRLWHAGLFAPVSVRLRPSAPPCRSLCMPNTALALPVARLPQGSKPTSSLRACSAKLTCSILTTRSPLSPTRGMCTVSIAPWKRDRFTCPLVALT